MRGNRYHIGVVVVFAILLAGCAKIVTPTGGPKDTTPPKVVKVEPADGTVRFQSKHIRIWFDEYVTTNNPTENVLVSPPLGESPEYTVKGKSVVIKLKDTLRPNTTYNMVFSDAIKDFHEGNALNYFHYSFSTGDSLDDYMVRGVILDAKTLAPAKDFYVLLYHDGADSLPLTTLPDYVSKSLADGSFLLKNIAPGDYKIFALKDVNSNFLFDLPNEEIAFQEELVTAVRALPDTAADSLKAELPVVALLAFAGEDTVQVLARYDNPAAGVYKFPYKHRFVDFTATPLDRSLDYFEQINATRDTVTWYLRAPLKDTVQYIFDADGHIDTVRIVPFKEKQQSGGRARGQQQAGPKQSVGFANAGEYHKPLTLTFAYPVRPTDTFSVWVYSQQKDRKDTVVYHYVVPDTFVMQLPLPMDVTEKKSYSVMIPDSVFFGYNGLTNDTLRTQFTTKSEKDYGTLIMTYQLPDDGKQYVATLWSNDKILQEDILTASETITYPFLNPGPFRVSVFCDENRNGRWDPGDYRKKRQPETMYNFPTTINIRAFWDSEETFTIKN